MPYDDFRTKAAQAERDAARAIGKLPLLEKHAELLWGIEAAIEANPTAAATFEGGVAERSVFFDVADGVPAKARFDYLSGDGRVLTDLKTTTDVGWDNLVKAIHEYGYYQQSALGREAFREVLGMDVSQYTFTLFFVEKKRPYSARPVIVKDIDIEIGAQANRAELDIMARCLKTGEWPGPR